MWTTENRSRYDRSKLRYPSDLTDEEWRLRAATSVFMTEDPRAARILTEQKTLFQQLEADAIKAHFKQMRGQDAALAEAKALHSTCFGISSA